MVVDMTLVKIIAERIRTGGKNPKTSKAYTLSDIKNKRYKNAISDYIEKNK